MKVKGIIFDLDGTLVSFPKDFFLEESLSALAGTRYSHLTRQDLENYFSEFDYLKFMEGESAGQDEKDFWGKFRWDRMKPTKLIPGAASALEKISQAGYKITLATARVASEEEIRKELKEFGIDSYFEAIVSRQSHSLDWHDKEPQFRKCLEFMGLGAEDVCSISDIPSDTKSAKNIGISNTVSVLTGDIKRHILEEAEPKYIIADVTGLFSLLK